MKKLLLTTLMLSVILGGSSAFAVIDTERLLSDDYLLNSGYSPETIRIIRIRQIDPYAPYQKKQLPISPLSWAKKLYQYLDPASETGGFGTGIIDPRLDLPSRIQNNY